MTALALSSDEVGLVFGRLNECQRRWVAGLLADMLGRGGTKGVGSLWCAQSSVIARRAAATAVE